MVELSKQSSYESASSEYLSEIFIDNWKQSLVDAKIFDSTDESKWYLTKDNMQEVFQNIFKKDDHKKIIMQMVQDLQDNFTHLQIDEKTPFIKFTELIVEELKALESGTKSNVQNLLLQQNIMQTPAQQIIKVLQQLQKQYLKDDNQGKEMSEKIDSTIDKIAKKTLYDLDLDAQMSKLKIQHSNNENGDTNQQQDIANAAKDSKRRQSVMVSYLATFSDQELQLNKIKSVIKSNKNISQSENQNLSVSDSSEVDYAIKSLQLTCNKSKSYKMTDNVIRTAQGIEESTKHSFNIFEYAKKIDRKMVLPSIGYYLIVQQLHLCQTMNLNQAKLCHYLQDIQKGYYEDVTYHNDLHGTDVCQMAFLQMTTGQLIEKMQLNHLDQLAFLMAALCHDFGHDGFTNPFHVNDISHRSIRYNERSVQENFHSAEALFILHKPKFNFLEKYDRDDYKVFRQRFIGCILATDMANHAPELANFKQMLETKQVVYGKNMDKLLNVDDPKGNFKTQQQVLDICMHANDISQGCRDFDVTKEWTYLLFDEFFHQGDIEKERGLPVSYLCDREKFNVAQCQPGFLNFIVIPLHKEMVNIFPVLGKMNLDRAQENVTNWEKYVETEQDKEVYDMNKKKMKSLPQIGIRGSNNQQEDQSSVSPSILLPKVDIIFEDSDDSDLDLSD